MTKCSAIDRTLKCCRCNVINDTNFCKKHDYVVDYTEEMLSNLQICSGLKSHIIYQMVRLARLVVIEENKINKYPAKTSYYVLTINAYSNVQKRINTAKNTKFVYLLMKPWLCIEKYVKIMFGVVVLNLI